MSIHSRISAIYDLGQLFLYLTENQITETDKISLFESFKEEAFAKFKLAEIHNPWFTQENIIFCIKNWGETLTLDSLQNWSQHYQSTTQPKQIGIIMAGNLPLVGLHDLICVLLSGHQALVKSSSKDSILMNWVIEKLITFNPEFKNQIQIVEKVQQPDAIIATGSNNTARYFEYYFKNIPHIIRKNRTSIAILEGSEKPEELQNLAKDIFLYFGLGCRNVTKLYLPENYNTDLLFEAFFPYNQVINHVKYANNYDYNRAIYLMGKENFLDNNFVMLRQAAELHSPIGVVHYEFYSDLNQLQNELKSQQEEIQCIATNSTQIQLPTVRLGETQKPSLTDYADGVDTMKFLESV